MTKYYVISPVDSPDELLNIPEQFNRSFVRLTKDELFYLLDSKIDGQQLKEFFEAYPNKEARSLIFSRVVEMPIRKNSPPRG